MHSGYVYKIHLKRALPATATNHSLFLGIIQVVSMGCSMKPLVSLCGIIFQCWHFKWSTFWFQYNYWLMHFWELVFGLGSTGSPAFPVKNSCVANGRNGIGRFFDTGMIIHTSVYTLQRLIRFVGGKLVGHVGHVWDVKVLKRFPNGKGVILWGTCGFAYHTWFFLHMYMWKRNHDSFWQNQRHQRNVHFAVYVAKQKHTNPMGRCHLERNMFLGVACPMANCWLASC